jgi:hypothetical protein
MASIMIPLLLLLSWAANPRALKLVDTQAQKNTDAHAPKTVKKPALRPGDPKAIKTADTEAVKTDNPQALKIMFFGDTVISGVHNKETEICPFRYEFLRMIGKTDKTVQVVGTNADPEGTCQKLGEELDVHNNGYRNAGIDELLDFITADLQYLHKPVDYIFSSLGVVDCLRWVEGRDYQFLSQSIRRVMGRLLNINENAKLFYVPIMLPKKAGKIAVECMTAVNRKLQDVYSDLHENTRIYVLNLTNKYGPDSFYTIDKDMKNAKINQQQNVATRPVQPPAVAVKPDKLGVNPVVAPPTVVVPPNPPEMKPILTPPSGEKSVNVATSPVNTPPAVVAKADTSAVNPVVAPPTVIVSPQLPTVKPVVTPPTAVQNPKSPVVGPPNAREPVVTPHKDIVNAKSPVVVPPKVLVAPTTLENPKSTVEGPPKVREPVETPQKVVINPKSSVVVPPKVPVSPKPPVAKPIVTKPEVLISPKPPITKTEPTAVTPVSPNQKVDLTPGSTLRRLDAPVMFLPNQQLTQEIVMALLNALDWGFRAQTLHPTPKVTKPPDYYGYEWCMKNYEQSVCFEYYYGYTWCLEHFDNKECYSYYYGDVKHWGKNESYKWCRNFYDEEYCQFAYLDKKPDTWDWLSFGYHDCLKNRSVEDCSESFYNTKGGSKKNAVKKPVKASSTASSTSDNTGGNVLLSLLISVALFGCVIWVTRKKFSCCKPKYSRLNLGDEGGEEVELL